MEAGQSRRSRFVHVDQTEDWHGHGEEVGFDVTYFEGLDHIFHLQAQHRQEEKNSGVCNQIR